MKLPLVTRLLEDQSQIDRSFPVANMGSGVSLDRWREFAAAWLRSTRPDRGIFPDRGIIVVQDGAGYMLGLCSFERREDLLIGPVLSVENLIALDLISGQRVARLLIENLESVARSHGLSAIQIGVASPTPANVEPGVVADSLAAAGYSAIAVRWVKALEPRPAALELRGPASAH
jgi:hypothetical protein